MTTLLFCTSYATSKVEWRLRYQRWVERARRSGLQFDRMVIIDDGSPMLPAWARVTHLGGEEPKRRWFGAEARAEDDDDKVELFHFSDNLGRHDLLDFPGWYRSFAYSAVIAREMGADKIVHLESDAALLSQEIVDYVNRYDDGWMSPYSAMYGFPEMAIQVVAGASVPTFLELFSQPYDWLRGRIHEDLLPYTHVTRSFIGDRYTGEAPIARDVDYVGQLPSEREDGFSWWDWRLGCATPECAPEIGGDALFRIDFTPDGEAAQRCGFGWAAPEASFRWMVGLDSYVALPPNVPAAALVLDVWPCLDGRIIPFQKLHVYLDGQELARLKLSERRRVRVELPAGGTGGGALRLHHPDAVRADRLAPGISDTRELSAALFTIAGLPA